MFQLHPRGRKYAWTGDNNYLMFGQAESLAIGGGGHYCIFIDGELNVRLHSKHAQLHLLSPWRTPIETSLSTLQLLKYGVL